MPREVLRIRCASAAVVLGTALTFTGATPVAAAPTGTAGTADPARLAAKLTRDVSVNTINRHLIALQRIAERNHGRRAASTAGHAASADYIAARLKTAGYDVEVQEFEFTYEETLAERGVEVSPTPRTLSPVIMQYSASTPVGGITGPLVAVPGIATDTTPGCEAADFAAGTFTGAVALVQRGGCTFQTKHDNALSAGAMALLIYNNAADAEEELAGRLTAPGSGVLPVGGLRRTEGEVLAADLVGGPVTITLELRSLSEVRTTHNLIAETRSGRADNVVFLGAHLDSVTDGPGVNDNGTGSAALLEVALKISKYHPRNKVRFAWWSAEEFGLVGSGYYVSNLSLERQLDIALYLNFDMIGSPNYGRFIYDGDDSDGVGNGAGPYGSAQIEDLFETYFDARALPHEGTDFSGRSDYGPFIAVGIPSGGLFTGAEGRKTAEQTALYGGTAGAPYDSCYHQACDNLGNVNREILGQMSDAVAWATGWYATSTADVNGDGAAAARESRRQSALTAGAARTAAPATANDHVRE